MISIQTFVCDSNGEHVVLPSFYYAPKGLAPFKPYDATPRNMRGKWFHVNEVGNGELFVIFRKGGRDVSMPVLLQGGHIYQIDADEVVPVAVRRGGLLVVEYSEDEGVPSYGSVTGNRVQSQTIKGGVFPTTNVPQYPGGPASFIWSHPNNQFGNAAPKVSGVGFNIASGTRHDLTALTAAHWLGIYVCAFNFDEVTGEVINVRRFFNLATAGTFANVVNPWDMIGVHAIPSATNPAPGTSPGAMFFMHAETNGVYARDTVTGSTQFGAYDLLP